MHIPDGFVSGPVNAATFALSAGAISIALVKARHEMDDRTVPLLGVCAAFVFAAQMLNFPVAGGTSGHFLGAVMTGVLLGPWNSCLILGIVLVIQALGFADGGITALGSNLFNMGIVGGIVGTYIFYALRWILPSSRKGFLAAVALASWASVVLASASCALMLAVSGTSPLRVALPAMVGVHALIGVGEAIITTAVVGAVLSARSDLVRSWKGGAA